MIEQHFCVYLQEPYLPSIDTDQPTGFFDKNSSEFRLALFYLLITLGVMVFLGCSCSFGGKLVKALNRKIHPAVTTQEQRVIGKQVFPFTCCTPTPLLLCMTPLGGSLKNLWPMFVADIMEPLYQSTTVPKYHCSIAPLYKSNAVSRYHCTQAGTNVPRYHCSKVALNQVTTVPRDHCTKVRTTVLRYRCSYVLPYTETTVQR